MWHEARKQERRIRGLIVDYRRRAERRQDFYEKIQADPTQFLQLHGRRCRIHLDPAVAAAGDGAAIIVPWQGQQDNLIDRFDVRAHLDYIPAVQKNVNEENELTQDERQFNYERYRILAQNDFLNITEEKFLHQLYLEEQYGAHAATDSAHSQAMRKKKTQQKFGAAIGYTYEDSGDNPNEVQPFSHLNVTTISISSVDNTGATSSSQNTIGIKRITKEENDSDTESESDIDMDVSIDVSKLDTSQAHELNACGRNYGMLSNDFYSYLTKDADEADALRIAREEQREKMLLSGRKSRRERKAQKERRIANRPLSPPSYAAIEDKFEKAEDTDSRSPSPADTTGKITYITSFGGEDELQPHSKISINLQKKTSGVVKGEKIETVASTSKAIKAPSYADKLKENLDKHQELKTNLKKCYRSRYSINSSQSRSRSRSYGRTYRSSRRSRSHSSKYEKISRYERRLTRSRSRTRIRYRSKLREAQPYSYTYRSTCRNSRSRSKSRRHHFSSRSSSSSVSTCSSIKRYHKNKRSPKRSRSSSVIRHKSRSYSIERKRQHHLSKERIPKDVKQVPSQIALSTGTCASHPASLPEVLEVPPPPIKRYYGRKRDQSSSSSSEETGLNEATGKPKRYTENIHIDPTSDKSNPLPSTSTVPLYCMDDNKPAGKYSMVSSNIASHSNPPDIKSSTGCGRLNLRERLKRKMQNLLNKQYKADKKAEIEKTEREKLLQLEREEEMRELALKLRRRQRELRHRHGSPNSDDSESGVSDKALDISRKAKRSKSPSIDKAIIKKRERDRKSSEERRSPSRERHRSGSRSYTYHRRYYKSRSRSHSRRSTSKRRRRSVSRSKPQRERSRERSIRQGNEKTSYGDRFSRRSRSRSSHQDRDRSRTREYYTRSIPERCREERLHSYSNYQKSATYTPTDASSATTSRSTSRIVISAPPKLKKLVDY